MIKLSLKDKSLLKNKEVKKWVKSCEKIINRTLSELNEAGEVLIGSSLKILK